MRKSDIEVLSNISVRLDNPNRKLTDVEIFSIECSIAILQNAVSRASGLEHDNIFRSNEE